MQQLTLSAEEVLTTTRAVRRRLVSNDRWIVKSSRGASVSPSRRQMARISRRGVGSSSMTDLRKSRWRLSTDLCWRDFVDRP
jgi:hypothetical protein